MDEVLEFLKKEREALTGSKYEIEADAKYKRMIYAVKLAIIELNGLDTKELEL